MFARPVPRVVGLAAVLGFTGCSAISDFDYSFDGRQLVEAGVNPPDSSTPPVPPPDTGVDPIPPEPDAGYDGGDTVLPDGGVCNNCCELVETSERTCSGGRDDDCDGMLDCADPDCRQAPECCPMPSLESGTAACTDKVDNDCDGLLDCSEPGCAGIYACTCKPTSTKEDGANPAVCLDQNDNDCDGLVDCQDNECVTAPSCCTKQSSIETGAQCTDGINNDCDLDGADCADPDCKMSTDAGSVAAESGAACGDNKDNDCDGRVDCKDQDCRDNLQFCCAKTALLESSCSDGINNDCDADGIDCFDADCALDGNCCKAPLGGESTGALCSNGVDDDCDGLVDCADSQCSGTRLCCVAYLRKSGVALTKEETLCTDTYDNDCDGLIDCRDSNCPTKGCGIIIINPPIEATQ